MNPRLGEMEELKESRASADSRRHTSLTNKAILFGMAKRSPAAFFWVETKLSVWPGSQNPRQGDPKAESQSVFSASPTPLGICTFLCLPITFRKESPRTSPIICNPPWRRALLVSLMGTWHSHSLIPGLCNKSAVRKRSFTSVTICVAVDGARAARDQPEVL